MVRVGIVQAKRTELSTRAAERFKTGVGRLRLGGAGAATAPQPIIVPVTKSRDASRSLATPLFCAAVERTLWSGARCQRFMLFQRKTILLTSAEGWRLTGTGQKDQAVSARSPVSSSGYAKWKPEALRRAGTTRWLSRIVASAISPKARRSANAGTRSSVGR